jgi:hypothetical protein
MSVLGRGLAASQVSQPTIGNRTVQDCRTQTTQHRGRLNTELYRNV